MHDFLSKSSTSNHDIFEELWTTTSPEAQSPNFSHQILGFIISINLQQIAQYPGRKAIAAPELYVGAMIQNSGLQLRRNWHPGGERATWQFCNVQHLGHVGELWWTGEQWRHWGKTMGETFINFKGNSDWWFTWDYTARGQKHQHCWNVWISKYRKHLQVIPFDDHRCPIHITNVPIFFTCQWS